MDAKLLLIQALSPLHAGTGQGEGVIDLPIAREKATNIPFLPGSTLKGVFREACSDSAARADIFGPDTGSAELYAGAANFSDARLLLMPVRSLRGVFAWVCSPLLLRRLARDAKDIPGLALTARVPEIPDETCRVATRNSGLTMVLNGATQVILEDLPLKAEPFEDVTQWAEWLGGKLFPQSPEWQSELTARLCLVSDDVLSFLLETGTEITARISMDDDKKTVKQGALWYEEALPAETVLAGLVLAAPVKTSAEQVFNMVDSLAKKPLQFGGKATVGRGLCQATLV